jgi:hypothetical protein
MPLALNYEENRGDDDQNQKNPHAGTLRVRAAVNYTNRAKTKRGRTKSILDLMLSSHDMACRLARFLYP